MKASEILNILEAHARWRSGSGGARANLSGANLYGADLYGAYLSGADLSGAYLSDANLSGADLSGANLYGANLYGANLYGAYLYGANLYGANLYGANLSDANLYGADLYGANLSDANLSRANLYGANLYGADLSGADLSDANLSALVATRRICPESGSFTAYKKLKGGIIAELLIPANAARVGGIVGRKCRAECALCVSLSEGTSARSGRHSSTAVYTVGEITWPDAWDPNPLVECASGIHFFMSRYEAEQYSL